VTDWKSIAPADLPEAVMRKALEMGADDVICTSASGDTKQIRFANSSVTASKSWASTSLGIYISKDRKILSTDVTMPSEIDRALDRLMTRVKLMQPNEEFGGIARGRPKYRKNVTDPILIPLVEELYDHVDAAVSAALGAGASRVAGVLYCRTQEIHQATSGGAIGSYASSALEISVRAMSDAMSSGHMVQSVPSHWKFDPARVGREAGELAVQSRNPEIGKEGKFDVLFSPMIFANILEHVGGSVSAGAVDAGMSFLGNCLGKRVASPDFSCFDDGTDPLSILSPPFDEEGVATGRTQLFERGVLKNYLHNTSTAKRYNVRTTGNAGLVFPNAWTVFMEPGAKSRDQLISQVDNGYYMTNTWYTRFQNYTTGDFSTIPRDAIFRIERGGLAGPVKDIRISESMLGLLERIVGVGNDPMLVHWWEVNNPVSCPHVLVKDVNITKSTQ